ncbi:MAG: OmpA family protein, partial [Candidatus Omnitrophica bacterium]|nr:OmpA family protein [Candidatus Omnitrophota bacterium]
IFDLINRSAESGGVALQLLINEGNTKVKNEKREQNIDGTLVQSFAIGKNGEVDADAQETMMLGNFIDGDFTLYYEFDVSDAMEGVKKEANIVTLKRIAKYLAANPEIDVIVNGYTDSVGTEDLNQALSEERAEDFAAPLRSMLADLGVSSDRVETVGHGEKYANVPEAEASADHAKGAGDRKAVFSFVASTTGKLEGIHAADRKSSTMTFEVDEHGLITNDEIRGFGVYDKSPGVSNRVMMLAKGKADEGTVAVAAGGKMIGDGSHIFGTRAWGEDVDAALLANNSNTRILGLRDFSNRVQIVNGEVLIGAGSEIHFDAEGGFDPLSTEYIKEDTKVIAGSFLKRGSYKVGPGGQIEFSQGLGFESLTGHYQRN